MSATRRTAARGGRVLVAVAAIVLLVAAIAAGTWRPPNVNTGYAPEQPLPYSHRLHAGELGIDCLYCHFGARTSRHAGIPPTGLCMNCHKAVTAPFDRLYEERELAAKEQREPRRIVSDPILRLYAGVGLDGDGQPLPGGPEPIAWTRVHNLPDFVAFDHSVHVARGVACETCHGPVRTMERMRQENDLSMGWCLTCHRGQPADVPFLLTGEHARLPAGEHVSTDCSACHY